MLALDSFVTPDERKWLARSANFTYAINHGDLADTFQREHPGVTIMWAGSLGLAQHFPDYSTKAPGLFAWDTEHLESWLADTGGPDPLDLLVAGRWWVVLAISLAVAISFLPLRRLFGEVAAILAALWVAWDPFAVALSRQLHPDGLVSVLSFLALLLFAAWLYTGRRTRYLVLSGIVMGLAWLTKTPAIFLAPTGAILIAIEMLRPVNRGQRGAVFWGLVVWGAVASAIFFLLWPALWVNPINTFSRMISEMGAYVEGHTNLNYWWGAPVADPGWVFYPVAYLFRATPATLIGLIGAAWLTWRVRPPLDGSVARRSALALLIFAVVFTLGMSIGAKKFDRYILPAFLALDVIAALGWTGMGLMLLVRLTSPPAPLLKDRGAKRGLWIGAGVVIAALILLHGIFTAVHYPYYLTYFNPLLGGSATAPKALWVGWGEGLNEAAEWLNEQPDAQNLRTAAFYYDGPFSYYFDGKSSNLGYGSPLFWLGMDYAVTYVSQWQRQIPAPETIAYFEGKEPVHTVRFRGLDLAKVYDLRGQPLPDFLDIAKENGVDFGDGSQGLIRLLAYEFEQTQANPGDSFQATLYEQALAPINANYNVLLRLVDEAGTEVWRSEGWPWGAPTTDWEPREVRPDGHTVTLPADLPPGLYRYLVSFYDPETLELLLLTDPETGAPTGGDEQAIALLQVGMPDTVNAQQPAWEFGGVLALEDAAITNTPQAGSDLALQLGWQSLARTGTGYAVFVHILDRAGEQVAGKDSPPLNGFAATNLLLPGQQVSDTISVPLPADLPAGDYTVRIGLYDSNGRLPVTHNGESVGDSAVPLTFTLP